MQGTADTPFNGFTTANRINLLVVGRDDLRTQFTFGLNFSLPAVPANERLNFKLFSGDVHDTLSYPLLPSAQPQRFGFLSNSQLTSLKSLFDQQVTNCDEDP